VKICDLALFSQETSSGVKTYIDSKIDYVRSRDQFEHVVIVPGRTDRVSVDGRSKVIVVRGTPTFYPGIHVAFNLRRIAALIEHEAPDIIELNCQYTLPWAAFLATRHSRTPIVGIYHTDLPACVGHWARKAGRTIAAAATGLTEFYEGLIYRHCTITIVLNETMIPRLRRLGVDRIRSLPCGVDVAMFHPGRRDVEFRRRLGLRQDQILLLYAGRLSPEKELAVLFEAYDRLPSDRFALLIAGDGPDLGTVIRHANGRPGITYLGHLDSRSALAQTYASSDMFVAPSRYETFGMATLEALASGLPVVGIQGSGTAAMVPAWGGLLARPGDPGDMAAQIAAVATGKLEDLRHARHAYAASRYSWDRVFDEYLSIYRTAIAAHRAQAYARA
jgi:alpha-1,6-mannosyltransferase